MADFNLLLVTWTCTCPCASLANVRSMRDTHRRPATTKMNAQSSKMDITAKLQKWKRLDGEEVGGRIPCPDQMPQAL
eukprot:4646141-Pleurochrysis_carterae.AAC.1